MPLVLIGVGGAVGAVARYLVDSWVAQRTAAAFPWGTLAVNVSGSFVLGIIFALVVERDFLPAQSRLPLMVGFVGAYTTFSTLMLESWRLVDGGAIGLALANVVGSSVLGLTAVVVGLVIGRALP
jgi:fluoride exporter